jgi:hypothetical protein
VRYHNTTVNRGNRLAAELGGMRIEFGPAQRGHELFATLHRSAGTLGHGPHGTASPSAARSYVERGEPPACPRTNSEDPSAHDHALMQSKDLSAPAATSADELQEDAARAHANVDDVNLRRD